MNESKKVVTTLDAGVAAPISVSKSEAYNIANKQTELNNAITNAPEQNEEPVNIVVPQKVDEIDQERVYQVNDFIKLEKKKTPAFTYIILILVIIILIIIFIIFELPILRGL